MSTIYHISCFVSLQLASVARLSKLRTFKNIVKEIKASDVSLYLYKKKKKEEIRNPKLIDTTSVFKNIQMIIANT